MNHRQQRRPATLVCRLVKRSTVQRTSGNNRGRRSRPKSNAGQLRDATLAQRLGAAATACALVVACQAAGTTDTVDFLVPVSAAEVATGNVEDLIVATGTLRAAESIVLQVETPGRLEIGRSASGSRLAEGDAVVPDQMIAEVTGEDARLAARVEVTHKSYLSALAERDARARLFEQELISAEELRRADTTLEEAKATWDQSLLTEDRAKMLTPIGGVLMELARDASGMPIADGQLVSQGFQVARIAPVDSLVADIDLVGPELARVHPGQKGRLRHFAFEDLAFEGAVVRLSPEVDPTTHTFRAEVAINNPGGLLRPGMFVEVTLVVEQRNDVPVVPREAIAERGGRRVVFVLDGQRAVRREVVLGLGDDDIAEIRQGLEVGERVVVRGLETLTDGTRVRVSG